MTKRCFGKKAKCYIRYLYYLFQGFGVDNVMVTDGRREGMILGVTFVTFATFWRREAESFDNKFYCLRANAYRGYFVYLQSE